MSEILFTPAAVLELLLNIEELADKNISLIEDSSGHITVTIGSSRYNINDDAAVPCRMDASVVDTIAEEADQAYQDLAQTEGVDLETPVESGILKGIVKSLLLGGMIRAIPKLIK